MPCIKTKMITDNTKTTRRKYNYLL